MLTISGETEHVPNIFVYLLYPHLHYAAISMYAMQLFKYVMHGRGEIKLFDLRIPHLPCWKLVK